MNKLWDDLKDNMKEWGVSAVEKAEEISRVAVAKGEEFTKISKLKIPAYHNEAIVSIKPYLDEIEPYLFLAYAGSLCHPRLQRKWRFFLDFNGMAAGLSGFASRRSSVRSRLAPPSFLPVF